MANAYYWFNNKNGPEEGALIREDGSVVLVNFRDHGDTFKVRDTASVGLALRNKKSGLWSAEMRHPVHGGTLWTLDHESPEAAAADLLAKARKEVEAEEAVRANPVAHLERELKRHDWYSAFSDDHGVWAAGERHLSEIRALMEKVPAEVAEELFAKYAPEA